MQNINSISWASWHMQYLLWALRLPHTHKINTFITISATVQDLLTAQIVNTFKISDISWALFGHATKIFSSIDSSSRQWILFKGNHSYSITLCIIAVQYFLSAQSLICNVGLSSGQMWVCPFLAQFHYNRCKCRSGSICGERRNVHGSADIPHSITTNPSSSFCLSLPPFSC